MNNVLYIKKIKMNMYRDMSITINKQNMIKQQYI